MIRRPPRSTRTDTLFPYTTLFRSLGEDVGAIPEGLYPGDYLVPVAQELAREFGDAFADKPEADWLALFRTRAVAAMMAMIRADLALLGIHHDVFASEAALQVVGKPEAAEADLRARDRKSTRLNHRQ